MIQELLGVVEDRKIPISGGFLGVTTEPVGSSCSSAHSTITSSTSSAAATSTTSSSTSNNAEQQNLRCPRCDSTNTKFCYYNNYNLTQPRHFCKTCRRYWTQGGALRNVPIGGGCRKTKSAGISLSAGKTGNGVGIKAKSPSSTDAVGAGKPSGFGAAGFGAGPMGFEHDLQSSPILWAAPQNSHLLSLLRAAQSSGVSCTNTSNVISNPNPNSIRNTNIHPTRVKEDGPMVGSHLVPEASLLISALNARNLGLDPLGQVPLGLCNSLWRSSQYQHPLQHQQAQHQQPVPLQQQQQQPQPQPQPQQNNNGFLLSESPGSGIQELIQRLRSTTNYTDHQAVVLGNGCSSSSSPAIVPFSTPTAATTTTATVLEPAPISGGEFGCWNSSAAPFTWASDHMPNINGAFP